MRALIAFLLIAGALAGCIAEDPAPDDVVWTFEPGNAPAPGPTDAPGDAPTDAPAVEPRAGIRFIAMGDAGTGKEDQYRVAAAVERVCAERGCDFALALGDNIYESGVSDEHDPQFDTKFEQPYANLSLPFWLTLGNHDNSQDPTYAVHGQDAGIGHWWASGNAEVAYTYRDDRASEKWNLPARYYAEQFGDATFFSLDTNTLVYRDLVADADTIVGAQEDWIDQAIAASNTTWRFAFGHHPYVSNGEHGDAGNYEGHNYEPVTGDQQVPHPASGFYVKEFFEDHVCDKVDVVFSGHDHDLQWLEPADACGGTEFIVSGSAAKTRELANEARNPAYFQQGGTLGFFWIEVVDDTFTGVVFDVDGTALFERSFTKVDA